MTDLEKQIDAAAKKAIHTGSQKDLREFLRLRRIKEPDTGNMTVCRNCGMEMPTSAVPIRCVECGSENTCSPYYC